MLFADHAYAKLTLVVAILPTAWLKKETQLPEEVKDTKPVDEMTEEEQMVAYEEEMKNSDWGHQPC